MIWIMLTLGLVISFGPFYHTNLLMLVAGVVFMCYGAYQHEAALIGLGIVMTYQVEARVGDEFESDFELTGDDASHDTDRRVPRYD